MKLILNIKDNNKAEHLLNFLKDLSFISIEKKEDNDNGTSIDEKKFEALSSIWKDYDIDLMKIRKIAWKRKSDTV